MLGTPVQKQVDLKVYGFYIGELGVPVAQVDVPIRAAKFLTVTPSYMGYSVAARGLNKTDAAAGEFTRPATRSTNSESTGPSRSLVRNFEISARNMYVRRFRPTPVPDMNRYRGRIAIARALSVQGHNIKPFASYETFYEHYGGWNRYRAWTGVTLPLNKHVLLQPSYMWESSEGSRAVHYVLFGLILNTK